MHLSTVLNTNVNEQRYIIEVNNGAKVNMKRFTTTGTAGTNCDDIMELVFLEVQFLI